MLVNPLGKNPTIIRDVHSPSQQSILSLSQQHSPSSTSARSSDNQSENNSTALFEKGYANVYPLIANDDEDIKSFTEYIQSKRNELKKKNCIITKEQYNQLIEACNVLLENVTDVNNFTNLCRTRKDLKWAFSYIKYHQLHKFVNDKGDIIADHEVVKPLPNGSYLRVAHSENLAKIIKATHIACGHKKSRTTHQKLSLKFLNISRELVESYCERCVICRDTDPIVNRAPSDLHPIIAERLFHHIEIDLVDFHNDPCEGYHYVMHVVDHQSNFHFIHALRSKTAEEVLSWLRVTFSIMGYPRILQSDNGSEFNNDTVNNYLLLHNVNHVNSMPYCPSTNGKVERGNLDIKSILVKLAREQNCRWYDILYESVAAMNTNYTRSIKTSPFKFVFGQNSRSDVFSINDHYSLMNRNTNNNHSSLESQENIVSNSSSESSNSLSESSTPFHLSSPISDHPLTPINNTADNNVDGESASSVLNNGSINYNNSDADIEIGITNSNDDCTIIEHVVALASAPAANKTILEILSDVSEYVPAQSISKSATESHINQSPTSPIFTPIDESDEKSIDFDPIDAICERRQQNIEEIRADGRIAYLRNGESMIRMVNALRNKRNVDVGDVVGIYIPKEYKKNGVNKLPAVVIATKVRKQTTTSYKLLHRKQLIEGWYEVSDFELLHKETYLPIVGVHSQLDMLEYVRLASKNKLPNIALRTAYLAYLLNSPHHLNNNSSLKRTSQSINNLNDGVPSKKQRIEENYKVTPPGSICNTCYTNIENDICNICNFCAQVMHEPEECEYVHSIIVQELPNAIQKFYCSHICFLNQQKTIESVFRMATVECATEMFCTGYVAYLRVPALMYTSCSVNATYFVPVIILEREMCTKREKKQYSSHYKYSVAVKDYTIDGWFYHSSLYDDEKNPIPYSLFNATGPLMQTTIDTWGLIHERNKYGFVTLVEVYKMYTRFGNYNKTFENIKFKTTS